MISQKELTQEMVDAATNLMDKCTNYSIGYRFAGIEVGGNEAYLLTKITDLMLTADRNGGSVDLESISKCMVKTQEELNLAREIILFTNQTYQFGEKIDLSKSVFDDAPVGE